MSAWNENIEIENIGDDDISFSGEKYIDRAFTNKLLTFFYMKKLLQDPNRNRIIC